MILLVVVFVVCYYDYGVFLLWVVLDMVDYGCDVMVV